jgi:hypothetical protein
MRNLLFLMICTLILALPACDDNTDCSTLTRNLARVRIVSDTDPRPPMPYESIFPALVPDSVITGTVLFNTTYAFPINPEAPTTTFYFNAQNFRDSLTLGYDIRYAVISELCGVEVIYSNLRVVSHSFDSVRVISTSFNRLTELNIEIVL